MSGSEDMIEILVGERDCALREVFSLERQRDAARAQARRWKRLASRLLQRIGKISEMFNEESRLRELESRAAMYHHHDAKMVRANQGEREAEIAHLRRGIEAYRAAHGSYRHPHHCESCEWEREEAERNGRP